MKQEIDLDKFCYNSKFGVFSWDILNVRFFLKCLKIIGDQFRKKTKKL